MRFRVEVKISGEDLGRLQTVLETIQQICLNHGCTFKANFEVV